MRLLRTWKRRLPSPFDELPWRDAWFYVRSYASSPIWRDAPPTELVMHVARARCDAGARVLDAGCGFGRDSWALSRLGFDVTGLDLSRRAIRGARALGASGPTFIRGRASELDQYVSGPFALAIDILGPASDLDDVGLVGYRQALLNVLEAGAGYVVVTSEWERVWKVFSADFSVLKIEREGPLTSVWLERKRN